MFQTARLGRQPFISAQSSSTSAAAFANDEAQQERDCFDGVRPASMQVPSLGTTAAALDRARVSPEELEQHVRSVSGTRVAGEHWQAVQDYCVETLQGHGYDVERWKYKDWLGRAGVNVIATQVGRDRPREEVWLSAHYDSVSTTVGADDNASGVAAVLACARVLSQRSHGRTIKLALWDQEELWLVGSTQYVEQAKKRGDRITSSFVFEMIGYTGAEPDQQFIALIGNKPADIDLTSYEQIAQRNGLPTRRWSLRWGRSDHQPFFDAGYPALLMFDTCEKRNPHYHKMSDTPDTLNYDFAATVTNTALQVATEAAERVTFPPPPSSSTQGKCSVM